MRYESGPSELARASVGDVILPTAPALRAHEKVFALREENLLNDTHRALHRYQIITVERDDRLVEFSRDLGPVEDYPGVGEILIWSLLEDSVDYVMDQAEAIRAENQISEAIEEWSGESTLVDDAVKMLEEERDMLLNRSQFSNATGKMRQNTGYIPDLSNRKDR